MPVDVHKAKPKDFRALQQMLELYQYELSDIWQQDSDAEARYGFDLDPYRKGGDRFHAHVALEGTQFVGFALVAPALVTRKKGSWMDQFFILKKFRRRGAGRALAAHVFQSHPGPWEVGQMFENIAAQAFWRSVIAAEVPGCFVEIQVTEGWWRGIVQQFHVHAVA